MQTVTPTTARSKSSRLSCSFDIVPAKRDDMGMIADFVRSSAHWYEPIVAERDMGEHAVDDDWADINFKRREFFIGLADHEPVGTISLQYFGCYAYLGYIYLNVEEVGKGYGHQLMRYAKSVAQQKGMRGMALIGHPQATWAKRAYLKFGFEIAASAKSDVLAWNGGVLEQYYEEEFELYVCNFAESDTAAK